MTQLDVISQTGKKIKFSELWLGDRFIPLNIKHSSLWTKVGVDTARKHSKQSQELKDNGYGYIGDVICSFNDDDIVIFVHPDY